MCFISHCKCRSAVGGQSSAVVFSKEKMSKLQRTQHAEPAELLSTKLAPPRLRSALVPRESLLTRLDAGLEHKLTLLSAPAGFGKTTLVSHWLSARMKDEGGRMKEENLHPSSFILPKLPGLRLTPATTIQFVSGATSSPPARRSTLSLARQRSPCCTHLSSLPGRLC